MGNCNATYDHVALMFHGYSVFASLCGVPKPKHDEANHTNVRVCELSLSEVFELGSFYNTEHDIQENFQRRQGEERTSSVAKALAIYRIEKPRNPENRKKEKGQIQENPWSIFPILAFFFFPIFWISGFFYSVDGQGFCNSRESLYGHVPLEAQQRYFLYRAILVAIVSQNSLVFVLMGYRTSIA